MMKNYTYLLINLLSVAVPLLFSFHPRIKFYKTWPAFGPAVLLIGALFIGWDILYTAWGVWGFNPDYLSGVYLFNLPLEEILFFICIPYATVFTYAALKTLIPSDPLGKLAPALSYGLIVLLLLAGIAFLPKLYTGVTFLATVVTLIFISGILKPNWMGYFYLTYFIIFAGPFLVVNGLLTGTFLQAPVVWYDDSQNMGLRIGTIPVEDFIYGFLLILMIVAVYEALLARRRARVVT